MTLTALLLLAATTTADDPATAPPTATAPATEAPATGVAWAQEPTSFLGFDFGLSEADFMIAAEKYPRGSPEGRWTSMKVNHPTSQPGLGLAWRQVSIPEPVNVMFEFQEGRLAAVQLTPRDYDTFKQILITKYGDPTKVETGTASNLMGASLSSEVLVWDGKNIFMGLKQRSKEDIRKPDFVIFDRRYSTRDHGTDAAVQKAAEAL